ncbi:hypothetical protein [Streptantibioticus silvisoli]|uniref:Uncharacterized protein n=1 Tax=Streptantibioticus silvisoli TaxID=2705255 RepID=A0ABT6W259_9ACTN|nr:hypothetical protein [Streptantibioticus silvisoli]MDI5964830.1 hypothetical protein [Streptantibioticus silvisoli]
MASTSTHHLLYLLDVDPSDRGAVMLVLAYRLAAQLERRGAIWGDPGTCVLSVGYPVDGVCLEITARIADGGA